MKVCIYGAGSIGGIIGAHLTRVKGVEVSLIARHRYLAALDSITALLGPRTALIPPTTGAPYWFFHGLKGPYEDKRLKRMDPGGKQWTTFGPQRAIGCAFWAVGVVPEPGVVRLENEVCYLPLGDLTDLERGKPLEIDALADSIADLGELSGVPTPTIDMVLALLKLRAKVTRSPSTA